MKIEIWSDFACPFCYIGIRRLKKSIEKFPYREETYIDFKSFELDPTAEKSTKLTIHELLSEKYNITVEEAKKMNENIGNQGIEIGLQFDFDGIQYTNTFDAHRLMKYAAKHDQEIEMAELLFKSYFTDSKNISDHETLIKLAEKVSLNVQETENILQTCKYKNSVKFDEELAKDLGIRSVPFFIFNEKYAISGAQPIEVFSEVLMKVWEEEKDTNENEFRVKKSKETYCCEDDGCCSVD